MEVSLLQAVLIGLVTYLGAIHTPWLLGATGGWYGIGRPLVAGTLVGLILGDVKTGMIIGATINMVFLGAISPGGAMAADLNFAGFIGTALAMITNSSPQVAVSLAVPIGLIGVFAWNAFSTINVFFVHMVDKYAAEGSLAKMRFAGIFLPQLLGFALRFVPAFLVVYFGAAYGNNLSALIPAWLTTALGTIGSILPAIGMALLLKMMINEFSLWSFFLIGFVMVAVLKISIVPLSVIGISLAFVVLYLRNKNEEIA
ncbi:PTS mannose/fructose/sorbose/N-acetylgalactosamine transporter subunit IIC [Propionispora vibrioides]|uniref:PTS system, mannose-specific IIC component n=1 Tax=Propionispora vibrioides TaxID=112903 RepID=A0A1H8T6D3_9FIRM|nr:PTS sugar transporter subunit IIC [Propionispora vibrioides]SEO86432.1 PTS system, mannose-specific IIC component [Propionispora vibrioides]